VDLPASNPPFQGRVLVAEDEPIVRDAVESLLEFLGFDVATTRDGREAVEAFSAAPDAFCLAILDLTMPRLGGDEAIRALHSLRPGLPCILTSGHPDERVLDQFAPGSRVVFLPKPYRMAELRSAIQGVLGRDSGGLN
jgi:two-component system, cell cycle sensor histidine kinase and response regulator CckA